MSNSFHGFFELQTSQDLLEKLRRDFHKLREAPLDSDAAFNFFVTAEHMLDWIYPKRSGKKQRETERRSSILLKVISHLANGAKHFEVEASHHESVRETQRSGLRMFMPRMFRTRLLSHLSRSFLVVTLDGQAAREYGPKIRLQDLAEKVIAYWESHPLIYGK